MDWYENPLKCWDSNSAKEPNTRRSAALLCPGVTAAYTIAWLRLWKLVPNSGHTFIHILLNIYIYIYYILIHLVHIHTYNFDIHYAFNPCNCAFIRRQLSIYNTLFPCECLNRRSYGTFKGKYRMSKLCLWNNFYYVFALTYIVVIENKYLNPSLACIK